MQTLIIYQLCESAPTDTIQTRLRDLLKARGYQEFVSGINSKGEKMKSVLPDNTFFKDRISPKDARAELRAAAKSLGITFDSCIAVEMIGWSGISKRKAGTAD